jgi:hypothetical protein
VSGNTDAKELPELKETANKVEDSRDGMSICGKTLVEWN